MFTKYCAYCNFNVILERRLINYTALCIMTSCIEVMWPNRSRHFYRSCLDIQDHRAAKRMPTIFTKYAYYSPPQTKAESRRLILNTVSAVQSQHCETDALSNRQSWECEMSFISWNVILKTHCNQDCFFTCTYDAVLHVCSRREGSEVNSGSCFSVLLKDTWKQWYKVQ